MKKVILSVLVFALLAGFAFADCTVTVTWAPSASADATQQELIYFNGTADVIKATFPDNTTASASFQIPVPIDGDYVFIRSSNGTETADSVHTNVGGVTPATGCTAITICQ